MTPTPTLAAEWERIAVSLPNADSFEENAVDLGYALDTDEFYAACIAQATD